ncbi:MAG: hypothetical protein ACE5E7_02270 [Anaerolineae bacterium]
MDQEIELRQHRSSRLLMFLGALWLVLAAALLYYQLSSPVTIKVEWETATELNTAGFQLYRSNSPDGELTLLNKDGLIPGKGNSTSGARYTFVDKNVEAGKTYYYVLEEVEYDSTTNRYDDEQFAYSVPPVSWWVILLTAVSVVLGLALLVTGLREGKS